MREVWKSVLAFLKNTIPEEVFVPWFGKVEFTEDSEPDIINISVPVSYTHLTLPTKA